MNTIKILHLSDIQFGKSNLFVGKKRYAEDVTYETFAESIASEVLTTLEKAPDIIIASGDIAESAQGAEYDIAERFFKLLLKKFENADKFPHLYIVPGNHDVNLKEAEACGDTKEADLSFKSKFKNYNSFLKSLFNSDKFEVTRERPYFVCNYNNELILLGLNSAISVSHEESRGFVSQEQVRAAIKEAEQLNLGNAFRMAIVHHNFTRYSDNDNENLQDADTIRDTLINGKFQLLLHGHRHVAGAELRRNLVNGKQIFILATGSAGLDSERLRYVPNQFQLITIDCDSTVKISVQRKVFSAQTVGPQGHGKWFSDISEGKSGDFHFFIYPEDIRNVVELIQQKGFPISSKTPAIHFSKGFENYELYRIVLDVAEYRLWFFGRKNRKLFDKGLKEELNKISEKRKKGLDFRVLFLSPNAPRDILYKASEDVGFKTELKKYREHAKKKLIEMGIEFNDVCKSYSNERTIEMIVVDNAVLFRRIELSSYGQAEHLTNLPFDVVSSGSAIGRDLINHFSNIWKNASKE